MAKRLAQYNQMRRCEMCGKVYKAARATSKTCSDACRQRMRRAGQLSQDGKRSDLTIKQLEMLLQVHHVE